MGIDNLKMRFDQRSDNSLTGVRFVRPQPGGGGRGHIVTRRTLGKITPWSDWRLRLGLRKKRLLRRIAVGDYVAILASILVGLIMGYLGWVLPSVGGSLVVPTMIVFGIGAAITVVSWVLGTNGTPRPELRCCTLGVGMLTVLASILDLSISHCLQRSVSPTRRPRRRLLSVSTPTLAPGREATSLLPVVLYAQHRQHRSAASPILRVSDLGAQTTLRHVQWIHNQRTRLWLSRHPVLLQSVPALHLVGEWSMYASPSNSNGPGGFALLGTNTAGGP